jgi:hypothetical protein
MVVEGTVLHPLWPTRKDLRVDMKKRCPVFVEPALVSPTHTFVLTHSQTNAWVGQTNAGVRQINAGLGQTNARWDKCVHQFHYFGCPKCILKCVPKMYNYEAKILYSAVRFSFL